MTNEEVVPNSDKAVAECRMVVSAAQPIIKPPEMNTGTSHNGNPNNLMSPQQLLQLQVKPNINFDSLVTSPPNYNRFSAMPVHPAPQPLLRYRPYDLMQEPDGTVNFLSQMEARCWVPIPVRRENPPSKETLSEWASSLQLGDGKRKPLDLKLSLGRF